jgi:chromate transporter
LKNILFILDILKLSLTSFGGPSGHLKLFLNTFTRKNHFLTEAEFYDLNTFTQLIPGASSSQLLCLIAYRVGGIPLSLLTLFFWIFPTAFILCLLSIVLQEFGLLQVESNLLIYLNPLVISFMILMIYRSKSFYMSGAYSPYIIICNTILLFSLFKHPFIIPILLFLNGIIGYRLHNKRVFNRVNVSLKLNYTARYAFTIFISIFILLAILSESSRKSESKNRYFFNLAEHNYRLGSTIYGGGDILIPMIYEQYVARPSATITKKRNPDVLQLNSRDVMSAAGIIRLLPGPIFSITSFTAPILFKNFSRQSQIIASIIATFFLFIPGFIIAIGVFDLWHHYRKQLKYEGIFRGINHCVYSLLIASTLHFFIELIKSTQANYILLIIMLSLLFALIIIQLRYNINNAILAILCLVLGILHQFL